MKRRLHVYVEESAYYKLKTLLGTGNMSKWISSQMEEAAREIQSEQSFSEKQLHELYHLSISDINNIDKQYSELLFSGILSGCTYRTIKGAACYLYLKRNGFSVSYRQLAIAHGTTELTMSYACKKVLNYEVPK